MSLVALLLIIISSFVIIYLILDNSRRWLLLVLGHRREKASNFFPVPIFIEAHSYTPKEHLNCLKGVCMLVNVLINQPDSFKSSRSAMIHNGSHLL
jgi:hypothetical protein